MTPAAGLPRPPGPELLTYIKRGTGFTWDQLARVFGVQRRSLHLWVKGARMNANNAERLEQVAAVVRLLDTGDPDRTRSALLRPRTDGNSTFDLLCAGRYREALTAARRSAVELVPPARVKRPPALPGAARRGRQGLSPLELVRGAPEVQPPVGRYLGVSPIPRET